LPTRIAQAQENAVPSRGHYSSNTQTVTASPIRHFSIDAPIRGVNLGGWLLMEKWIAPRAFGDLPASDEYDLGTTAEGRTLLQKHRESFIIESDFQWIAARGLDAVRLPVGYWILEDASPYVAAPEILDRAFAWANKYGLGILLDLHGAPGSQNGSGHSGETQWDTSPAHIERTLTVLEEFARRYGQHPNLIGIELLNEPRIEMPLKIIKEFSLRAYERNRPHAQHISIVIHDAFRPLEWDSFMVKPKYDNVILDTHLYQCYSESGKKRTIRQHVEKSWSRIERIADMQRQLPVIIGEWSLSLRGQGVQHLSPQLLDLGRRAYGASQLSAYETSHGWFFWTYKTNNPNRDEWSFRTSVERGWLPQSYHRTTVQSA
jgi:glucan 1,3-beta-glucosidase